MIRNTVEKYSIMASPHSVKTQFMNLRHGQQPKLNKLLATVFYS